MGCKSYTINISLLKTQLDSKMYVSALETERVIVDCIVNHNFGCSDCTVDMVNKLEQIVNQTNNDNFKYQTSLQFDRLSSHHEAV